MTAKLRLRAERIYAAGKPHHSNVSAYHRWRRAAHLLGEPTHQWKTPEAVRKYNRTRAT